MKTKLNIQSSKSGQNTATRCYMAVNVIMTFNDENKWGDTQEFLDIKLPVSSSEQNAVKFIDKKLFKRIEAKCQVLGRDPRQLIKISTASNWRLFEEKTGKSSLDSLGHSCKWHFGQGRLDLDEWETELASKYGFGNAADLSWVNEPDPAVRAELYLDQVIQRHSEA
jgi:hypothetical protein